MMEAQIYQVTFETRGHGVGGRIGFLWGEPEPRRTKPQAGETWNVQIARYNSTQSSFYMRLVEKV